MLTEKLLKLPGFLYEIEGTHYYLGKWICKECTDTDASDCAFMYKICRKNQDEPDSSIYFQKIRAYSDFALEVPCNPTKIKADMLSLIDRLSDKDTEMLEMQVMQFEEDLAKY